ncbi:hypothetical protein A5787_05095 [Mycobacterium sp. 852002-50816_SCH5313054-b]|uniref:DUF5642 family protein n=1 Tax=Mycobacterium sp. 852002-50816_SCH5313054-b TaxID=1834092 RepID=UPI0007FD0A80|nr:DUF5642 family protein [Mycobacterium sp. 852002-50816_SCH5313054-b]OBF54361.1 hypothetical protein A5787_05095 [Mycobacterium sp. 852002-50816_SCH5313054-b]
MRPFWIGVSLVLLVACAQSPAPPPSTTTTTTAHSAAVNPANIKRVVRDLPPNYEVTTGIPSGVSPRVIWSLEADARADPPQCAALADPGTGRDQTAQGFSASGTGGIVNAVVVALPGLVDLDRGVVGACGRWTMSDGHTTATVRLVDAPHIDGAETVGMVADTKSSVESGTEIDSRAYTFTAYLGNYYAFTTLTTDPGSALPALPPQFAADLLVKTVSTLRG